MDFGFRSVPFQTNLQQAPVASKEGPQIRFGGSSLMRVKGQSPIQRPSPSLCNLSLGSGEVVNPLAKVKLVAGKALGLVFFHSG